MAATMRVAILTSGSRGDFQPFLALGIGLQKEGHAVKFYTARDHCQMAEDFGFPSTVICRGIEGFIRGPDCKTAMETGDWGTVVGKVKAACNLEEVDADPDAFYKKLSEDFKAFKPDALVWNGLGLMQISEAILRYIPEVPRIHVELQPQVMPSNEYKSLNFGRELPDPDTPAILTHLWCLDVSSTEKYQQAFAAKKSKEEICALMDEFPPPELMYEDTFEPDLWLTPRFMAYSRAFYPDPADWPKSKNVTVAVPGCLKISKETQDECVKRGSKYFSVGSDYEKCEEFIARVGKPVYIGWGSMFVYTTQHMTRLAVEAVKHANAKAIISAGWAGLGLDSLEGLENEEELRKYCEENVLFVKAAPHDLLFPKCSVAVHHGGIGTLQASVGAGCPTVITPVFSDQFDNGKMLETNESGVVTTRLGLLQSDELGDAIAKVLKDPRYAEKAKATGAAMEKEDGVGSMVSWLSKFFREEIQTGVFQKRRKECYERIYELRKKNIRMSSTQMQAKFQGAVMSKYPVLKEWQKQNMKFAAEAADLANKGKLWWVTGASVLARSGEGLKTDEAGRFRRFDFVEELARKGTRLHIRKLKGKGPSSGWVTTVVKGTDMVQQIKDPMEVGKVSQMQFDELFADMAGPPQEKADG